MVQQAAVGITSGMTCMFEVKRHAPVALESLDVQVACEPLFVVVHDHRVMLESKTMTGFENPEGEFSILALEIAFVEAAKFIEDITTVEDVVGGEKVDIRLHVRMTGDDLLVNEPLQQARSILDSVGATDTGHLGIIEVTEQGLERFRLGLAVTVDEPDQRRGRLAPADVPGGAGTTPTAFKDLDIMASHPLERVVP